MKKNKNLTSPYTEDWLPLKQIVNGMIELENGEFVTGIKVAPKNIFILDQGAQDNIIYQLQTFYNMIDYEFWLIIADRPVDINMYISQLQVLYNNTQDAVSRKIIMQDINKANMFMTAAYNVVDTEYFILFKEKRPELIQKNLHNMISSLANCGLNSSQVSNDDLRMLLDNFFNDRVSTDFGTVMA
ncbi:MAG: hypothetical protein IJ574_01250 [Bacilli bacterium]|nr:hypothetical protein [Bacilli bacterium]